MSKIDRNAASFPFPPRPGFPSRSDRKAGQAAGETIANATGPAVAAAAGPAIDPFRARHLSPARRAIATADGPRSVTVDEAENPLAWLARRRGRDGAALIDAAQFAAGERLRADFTYAQLTPRVTADWSGIAVGASGGGEAGASTEVVIAARQRLRQALDAVGPEFAGLLLDVCCFLKRLEEVERERQWPSRSAKVVLQLGLDRLARHYGYRREIVGPARQPLRTWLAEDAEFVP